MEINIESHQCKKLFNALRMDKATKGVVVGRGKENREERGSEGKERKGKERKSPEEDRIWK